MKKLISFISCIAMCVMFAMPVSAAEVVSEEETITMTEESVASVYSTNYFRKITTKLNSVYGNPSNTSKLSSGSISGTNPKITSLTIYSRVSSGSDPFYVYVEDPKGNIGVAAVSSSGTITTDVFNGLNPAGDWYVWIVTAGDVSTATITLTVNYSY